MKPWHMIEKAQREHVIRVVESFVAPGSYGLVAEHANAYRAAAALLAEAAPYPDEALVVSDGYGRVGEIVNVDQFATANWSFGILWFDDSQGWLLGKHLTPLTPAARDLLAALKGD